MLVNRALPFANTLRWLLDVRMSTLNSQHSSDQIFFRQSRLGKRSTLSHLKKYQSTSIQLTVLQQALQYRERAAENGYTRHSWALQAHHAFVKIQPPLILCTNIASENANFIYPDVVKECETAYYDASVVIRSSGRNVFHACLIYRTEVRETAYLAVESGQRTTVAAAMMSLLQQTAAVVERSFEARVLRT